MKKRCIMSVCVAVLMAINTTLWVNAETLTVIMDKITEKITVSGTVEEAVNSGKVSLLVTSDNNDIAHMANINTDKNGSFTYSFMMGDAPSGNYRAMVSAYNRTQPLVEPFDEFYVSSARKLEILNHINNNIADVDALKLYLTADIMREIGVSWPASLNLSQTLKDKIYSDIFAGRTYAELKDLKELFYKNISIYALNEATQENIVSVWNEYNAYYDTSKALMNNLYKNYSETNKTQAVKRMAGGPVDMVKNFNAAVFLQEIYLSKSYSDVNELFRDYSSAVTFDLTKFNSLESVTRGNALYGKSYNNMKELETAINSINSPDGDLPSDDPEDGSESGTGTGTGAGSGGGAGGGGGAWGIKNSGKGEVIDASPVESPDENMGLKDVSPTFWAYDAICSLVDKGVISGYPDNTFLPEKNITREEFITVLVKYLKLDINAECKFSDIPSDRWSYPYIAAAYSEGIVTGNEKNMFNPEDEITRQDMAVIVARALKKNEESTEAFKDEDMISDYAKSGVKALKAAGIINGFEDNTFRPTDNAKRAEAVTIIYKIDKGV